MALATRLPCPCRLTVDRGVFSHTNRRSHPVWSSGPPCPPRRALDAPSPSAENRAYQRSPPRAAGESESQRLVTVKDVGMRLLAIVRPGWYVAASAALAVTLASGADLKLAPSPAEIRLKADV